jgi:prepilin-type N-terminal cleavage/methylation domain-containing protein
MKFSIKIRLPAGRQGFTLIEVIIYLALFSILMAGSLSAAFALCESSGHERTRAFLLEEGNFIIAKTEWEFSVEKNAVFDPATLVGGRVSLTSIQFYHATDTSANLESVGMSFTLAARTEQGALMSQSFFSTTTLTK